MLRLVINNKDVELYEDAPVNLKFQFSDIERINNPLASYSQAFRVPLTQNNTDIFGNIDQVTERNGLNLQTRLSASLLSDTYPIMDGFVQVKAVYLTKEIYPEVELVFFSGAVDFKSELEGLFLSDLNLSSYDHDLTYVNVALGWSEVTDDYRYGIVDTGQNWTSDTFGTADNPVLLPQLTLFFQAKALLDKIFSEAGLTYESTYLEGSDFEKMYVMFANGDTVVASNDAFDESAGVCLASNQTIATSTTATVDLVDTGNNCYDQANNWSNFTHKFTVGESGLYNVNALVRGDHSGNFQDKDWKARVVVDPASGSNYNLWERQFFDSFTFDWSTRDAVANDGYNGPVVLLAGDKVYLEVQNESTSGSLSLRGTNNFIVNVRNTLEVVAVAPIGGNEVDVAANAPKMLQLDFVTSLQAMFNLVFIPDANRPNHFLVDTFEDFMSSGDTKDWSSKVDYGKDVVIKPTTDLQAAQYRWTYSSGKDFVSKTVEESLGRVYGEYEVNDTGNEFATGQNEVKTKFAPYLMSLIPNTATPILRLITQEGKAVQEPTPRIAYWSGFNSDFGEFTIKKDNGTDFLVTAIPTMSNFNTTNPEPGDFDLNYGMEPAMYPLASQPWEGLYFRFWAEYVLELYSRDARILSCNMNLTEADLQSWSFNDKIYIKDTYYRILSISYDANAPGMAQVELIRKLDDIALCSNVPTGMAGEFVLFNDSTPLDPDYGNQLCCEYYGYTWRAYKGTLLRCFPNTTQLDI